MYFQPFLAAKATSNTGDDNLCQGSGS